MMAQRTATGITVIVLHQLAVGVARLSLQPEFDFSLTLHYIGGRNRNPNQMSKRRTTVYVDPVMVERLTQRFPMQGVMSWLMEQAMTSLLDATDGQPDLEELVRSSIRASLLRARIARRAIANASPSGGVPVTALEIQRDDWASD